MSAREPMTSVEGFRRVKHERDVLALMLADVMSGRKSYYSLDCLIERYNDYRDRARIILDEWVVADDEAAGAA